MIFVLPCLVLLNQYAYSGGYSPETNAETAAVLQCCLWILAYTCIKDRLPQQFREYAPCFVIGGLLDCLMVETSAFYDSKVLIGLFSAFTYSLISFCIDLIKWGSILVIRLAWLWRGILLFPFSGLIQHQWQFRLDILFALLGIIVIGTFFPTPNLLEGTSW